MSRQELGFAASVVRYAARTAPSSLSARLEEEWLADLSDRPSGFSRLRFAMGCCWATRTLSREHRPLTVPVASTAEARAFIGYPPPTGFFSRRAGTFFLVVGLHAAVFYGVVMAGLTLTFPKTVPLPFQVQTVNQPPPKVEPTTPPKADSNFTKALKLPPLIWPVLAKDPDRLDIIAADRDEVTTRPQPPQQPPHQVQRVQGGPGAGFPNPDDYYPSAARRLEEQGLTTVRVCVDANGRLTSVPTEVESSGSARLDEAALKLARAGSGHYRASMEDGRAVSSCYEFRVRFQIKN